MIFGKHDTTYLQVNDYGMKANDSLISRIHRSKAYAKVQIHLVSFFRKYRIRTLNYESSKYTL